MGKGIVVLELEVIDGEGIELGDGWIDPHRGECARSAAQLFLGLFDVIVVEVQITKGVDEFTGLVATHLGEHLGEKGVRCDVEGNSEEDVSRALIELAGKTAVCHIKLKQTVTWWQSHLLNRTDIPGTNQ